MNLSNLRTLSSSKLSEQVQQIPMEIKATCILQGHLNNIQITSCIIILELKIKAQEPFHSTYVHIYILGAIRWIVTMYVHCNIMSKDKTLMKLCKCIKVLKPLNSQAANQIPNSQSHP